MAKFAKQTVPFSELMQDDKIKIGGKMFIVVKDSSQTLGASTHRVELEPLKIRRSGKPHTYHALTMPGHTKVKIYNKK